MHWQLCTYSYEKLAIVSGDYMLSGSSIRHIQTATSDRCGWLTLLLLAFIDCNIWTVAGQNLASTHVLWYVAAIVWHCLRMFPLQSFSECKTSDSHKSYRYGSRERCQHMRVLRCTRGDNTDGQSRGYYPWTSQWVWEPTRQSTVRGDTTDTAPVQCWFCSNTCYHPKMSSILSLMVTQCMTAHRWAGRNSANPKRHYYIAVEHTTV